DIADEAVLSLKESSPPPWVEVHCHGGRAVVDLLLAELERTGISICSWPEFLRLVEPPPRAAALERLAHARTARTAAILLDQVNGALQRAFDSIRHHLPNDPAAAQREIDELLQFAFVGRHLVEPWRVVVAGAPNVGKSSLVNALAGYQRSVVA